MAARVSWCLKGKKAFLFLLATLTTVAYRQAPKIIEAGEGKAAFMVEE